MADATPMKPKKAAEDGHVSNETDMVCMCWLETVEEVRLSFAFGSFALLSPCSRGPQKTEGRVVAVGGSEVVWVQRVGWQAWHRHTLGPELTRVSGFVTAVPGTSEGSPL